MKLLIHPTEKSVELRHAQHIDKYALVNVAIMLSARSKASWVTIQMKAFALAFACIACNASYYKVSGFCLLRCEWSPSVWIL